MNWLDRARREIQENVGQPTANTAERNLTSVTAVPDTAVSENMDASNVSNGSRSYPHFRNSELSNGSEIQEKAIPGTANTAVRSGLFDFSAPTDPDNDAEALAERTAIMVESGIPEPEATQEARWGAHREACWRRFLAYAGLILGAPEESRPALLDEYRRAATETFGSTTAGYMAATMKSWIALRPDDQTRH